MADWLAEHNLSTAADVLEDYGPFTLEKLKNLKRKEVLDLGMDDELNDNEMKALELALEWPEEVKRKKPGDYPKGRVVIKVQIRGGATGSGLQYSFKEARISHPKLEPNDNGDVELCENIAEQITTDEAMNEKYLPMTAEKISLSLDYALDDGSSGKPAEGAAEAIRAAKQMAGSSGESAVAQAKSEHARIMAEYDAVKAAIAEAEDLPDQADEVETQTAKLEALMTEQEDAKVKMEQAAAWFSAETEHAAVKEEVAEVDKLVTEAVVAEGDENPHQGRLDALKQAEKDVEEKLKDAKEAHGEPDDGVAAAVEQPASVDGETPAVGDSWTLTLTLPGDAGDDWEKTTAHGEKACKAVEHAVAGALDLAGDEIDGFAVEVVAVMEHSSKLKKKMEKQKRKVLAKRKAARVAFFGVDEEGGDKENGDPQGGKKKKKTKKTKGGNGADGETEKKSLAERWKPNKTEKEEKPKKEKKDRKKLLFGRKKETDAADDDAADGAGPEPEIEGEGESLVPPGDGEPEPEPDDGEEALVPPAEGGDDGDDEGAEPEPEIVPAEEEEEEEIDWSVNNKKTRAAKKKRDEAEKQQRKEEEKARKLEEKRLKQEEKAAAKEAARLRKAEENLEREAAKAIKAAAKAIEKAEKQAAKKAKAKEKADAKAAAAADKPEPEPEPEPEVDPAEPETEASLAERISARAAEQQAEFDADEDAPAAAE